MAELTVARTVLAAAARPLVSVALAAAGLAGLVPPAGVAGTPPAGHRVAVVRTAPHRAPLPTLRFLRAHTDLLRAHYALSPGKPAATGAGTALDPRYLAYRQMLRDLLAQRDSAVAAADRLERLELLASIAELGRLEDELDAMDHLLAEQRTRLAALQQDFTTRQQTALLVIVTGSPADVPVTRVTLTLEEGDTVGVDLTAEQRASLRMGGAVEVFHGFVEPREQVVGIAIAGGPWPGGDRGYVTLDPPRDRLTLVRLDLSAVGSGAGAAGIEATSWTHDERLPPGGG